MITKKSIILDIFFYFGKSNLNYFVLLISSAILFFEELVWRSILFSDQNYLMLSILVSSIGFGACHIVFGKLQVIFKIFLGIILTVLYLLSKDILFVMTVHATYNYFMIKKSGKEKIEWL
ncbi:CPBP family intramembrane glutamic endopeptidase [Enterococcus faecalis]|uniref:CPBP family intramembrane glutamic endopeptidase n=1 Tax=Enterococcus faecalis TaxID=1351 RepID=UPI002FBEBE4E